MIINEVQKLTQKGFIKEERIKEEKYQYIDELVTTINEYNDILAPLDKDEARKP